TEVETGEPALREYDLAQEAGEEVAPPARRLAGQELPLEAQAPGEGAHDAIDGAALLRSTGEVHTAQQRDRLELGGRVGGLHKIDQSFAQERELLRKAIEQGTPSGISLLLESLGQARVQPLLQGFELSRQRRGVQPRLPVWKGKSPDLPSFIPAEGREELG